MTDCTQQTRKSLHTSEQDQTVRITQGWVSLSRNHSAPGSARLAQHQQPRPGYSHPMDRCCSGVRQLLHRPMHSHSPTSLQCPSGTGGVSGLSLSMGIGKPGWVHVSRCLPPSAAQALLVTSVSTRLDQVSATKQVCLLTASFSQALPFWLAFSPSLWVL